MEEIIKDSRFSHIVVDPRFKRISRREKKVKIDKRFQSMFKDKSFKVNYTVDKRGRPITQTSNEDLKKYYALSSEDEDEGDSEYENANKIISDTATETNRDFKHNENFQIEVKPDGRGRGSSASDGLDKIVGDKNDGVRTERHSVSSEEAADQKWKCLELNPNNEVSHNADEVGEENEVMADSVKKKLRDLTVDYARGEGVLFSDSSSDEDSSESGLSYLMFSGSMITLITVVVLLIKILIPYVLFVCVYIYAISYYCDVSTFMFSFVFLIACSPP
jgi:hypothetical protein